MSGQTSGLTYSKHLDRDIKILSRKRSMAFVWWGAVSALVVGVLAGILTATVPMGILAF